MNPYSRSTSSVCSPIKGSLLHDGTAGVLDRRGAGLGLISSWSFLIKDLLCLLCWWEATSSKDKTGVTQASVPSNILHHSACVFCANMDANFFFILGQSEKLNWLGSLSESSPRPERRKTKFNCNVAQINYQVLFTTRYVSQEANISQAVQHSRAY